MAETTYIRPPEHCGETMSFVVPPGLAMLTAKQEWHCFPCGAKTTTRPGLPAMTALRPSAAEETDNA